MLAIIIFFVKPHSPRRTLQQQAPAAENSKYYWEPVILIYPAWYIRESARRLDFVRYRGGYFRQDGIPGPARILLLKKVCLAGPVQIKQEMGLGCNGYHRQYRMREAAQCHGR